MKIFPTVRAIANGWARDPDLYKSLEPNTSTLARLFTRAGTLLIYGLHGPFPFHTILEMAFPAQNACQVVERLPYMLSVVS